MSTSKFLPFQDVNGDGLQDVCDDVFVEEVEECPSKCSPNPRASVPDWRKRSTFQPFLNEKVCKYQITIVAGDYTTTGIEEGDTKEEAEAKLAAIFDQYVGRAIEVLLQVYDKEPSEGAVELIRSEIDYTSFFLEPRRKSRLKLLYSIDFDTLNAIPDAAPSDEDTDEGPIEVTFVAKEIGPMMIRVRKGLHLYARYKRVYEYIDGSSLRFTNGNKVFDLDIYGDFGFNTSDSLLNILTQQLSDFLANYGYNIPSILGFGERIATEFKGQQSIYEITFSFSEDYKVEKIVFFTEQCGSKPITMTAKLQHLNQMSAWKDPTAVAYFANLYEMDQELQAREPTTWIDYIIKYTYPSVYSTTSLEAEESSLSCLTDALLTEGKELGQDLLGTFSIADAIAYQFSDTVCKASLSERKREAAILGTKFEEFVNFGSTSSSNLSGSVTQTDAAQESENINEQMLVNVYSMAAEQAYAEIEKQKNPLDFLCAWILNKTTPEDPGRLTNLSACAGLGLDVEGNPTKQMLETMYEGGFDRLKVCGLFDLTFEVINCLMGGLTLEQALSKIVQSALEAMSIDSFQKLFIGLPPEIQQELDGLVQEKLESGDIFQDGEMNQAVSDAMAGGRTVGCVELNPVEIPDDNPTENTDPLFDEWSSLYQDAVSAAAEKTDANKLAYTIVKSFEGSENFSVSDFYPDSASELLASANNYVTTGTGYSLEDVQKARQEEADQLYLDYITSVPQSDERTIAQSFESIGEGLNPNVVREAYMLAIIEYYSDNLLDLVDELGKFPGAPLIANILALLDCPRPPLFTPSLTDFIKDYELPFCRNTDDVVFPKLTWRFGILPKIKDIFAFFWEVVKCQIQLAIIRTLAKIMTKLCELIGSAFCNALAITGDILASLPDGTNFDELKNIVREGICGAEADDDKVNDTITDMIGQLGVGGAAFANQEQTIAFAEDMSASLTRAEMNQLFLGDAPDQALDIMDSLLEYEYPEFRSALPNKQAINSFFKGMGNLMPLSFKDTMRDFVDGLAVGDNQPANPSLCLDPEKYDDFCELRASLLEGRALPEQSRQMCDDLRGQLLDDLGSVADIAQNLENLPDYLASQLPPLESAPGCDDGVIPYEPEEAVALVTAGLGNELEQLKTEFSEDMIGNGPGDRNWGMLNMILSDTLGVPLTAHNRLAANRRRYVDYYTSIDYTVGLSIDGIRNFYNNVASGSFDFGASISEAAVRNQEGAFPTHVGRYLQEYISNISDSIEMSINNDFVDDNTKRVEITRNSQRDITSLPDFGYDVEIVPYLGALYDENGEIVLDEEGNEVQYVKGYDITEKGRKRGPDVTISFYDSDSGKFIDKPDWYSYGFEVKAFMSDLEAATTTTPTDEGIETSTSARNIYSDNMRIRINEVLNLNIANAYDLLSTITGIGEDGTIEDPEELSGQVNQPDPGDVSTSTSLMFEFMTVDDTFSLVYPDGTTMNDYLSEFTSFQRAFTTKTDYSPQTLLLKEMLEKENRGLTIDPSQMANNQSSIMKNMMSQIFSEIAGNLDDISGTSWSFGSTIETLETEDLDYGVVADAGNFVLYDEAGYDNSDMILGISRDQYKNEQAGTPEKTRVFYLDPADYGRNYTSPPVYIRPPESSGWLGMLDIMFPELNNCDPKITDLVDFGNIQSFIDDIYPTMPEDERALSDPECVIELPYNRFIERSAKAGMMGLIKASIRIYAVTHFIKAYPTFTKFSPDFRNMFGSAFASYVIENMKKSFLDAQPGVAELFNTFKDSEFWYSFLEQSVQMYGFLVDKGMIMDPPATVLQAIGRLNDLQEEYVYPDDDELKEAKEIGETRPGRTLKNYRQELNLEAVRQTEEDAKLVMKELVIMELEYVGQKFLENADRLGISVDIKNSDYYFFEKFTQGGESLTLNSALRDDGTFTVSTSLPSVPYEDDEDVVDPYYTFGGELVVDENAQTPEVLFAYGLEAGQEYVGEYHVHISETTGQPVYMVGPVHSDELHPVLIPLANISRVEFGDVAPIYSSVDVANDEKPFIIEKYIRINDTLHTPDNAVGIIASQDDQSQLISDVYPGTMRLVLGPENTPIGVDGELGVRYGLRFSMIYKDEVYEITRTEIDALDTTLKDFANLNGNTKLLLCLINNLKKDKNFTLISKYIFSPQKMLSLAAIYNDLGMIPSIGQISVEKGKTTADGFSRFNFNEIGKPGQALIRTVDDDGNVTSTTTGILSQAYNPITGTTLNYNTDDAEPAPLGAWAHPDDRKRGIFFKEWDNWDKVLLRNSTSRIKRLFKTYYNSRFYDNDDFRDTYDSPGSVFLERAREIIRPNSITRLMPWWLLGSLRTNPFNANDEICEDE